MTLQHRLATCSFSVFVLLASACDRTDDSSGNGKPFLPLIGDPDRDPVRFNLADSGCQASALEVPLTATMLHFWQGDVVESAMTPLQNIKTAKSLVSPGIRLTTYGDVYERVCDMDLPAGEECSDDKGREKGWSLQDTKGPLRVCNDSHDYGRDTYEAVGLAAAHFVEKAYGRYEALAPDNAVANLKPLYLSVLPDFIDYYDNVEVNGEDKRLKVYITHNMAYFPSGPMIAVFPEGKHHVGDSVGYFWESAFVLAHEFGHHIDTTRHGQMLSSMGLSWNPAKHGYEDDMQFMVPSQLAGSGGSPRSQVMGAVGESFADLIAYYSLGGKSDTLVGLPCFGKNRDIGRATFLNDDAKILTDEHLFDLVHGSSGASEACGNPPDYSDIHNIGAIIAHAVDQTFAVITAQRADIEPGSQADFDERYKMALSWLDIVTAEALAADGSDAKAMVQPVGTGLLKVAQNALSAGFPLVDDGVSKGKSQVCLVAAELLPTLDRPPFAAASGACPE